jgi:predicted nucleic acid-binding protein
MEGKEWVWEGGVLKEMNAAKAKQKIETLSSNKKLNENAKLRLFGEYLINL